MMISNLLSRLTLSSQISYHIKTFGYFFRRTIDSIRFVPENWTIHAPRTNHTALQEVRDRGLPFRQGVGKRQLREGKFHRKNRCRTSHRSPLQHAYCGPVVLELQNKNKYTRMGFKTTTTLRFNRSIS